MKNQIETVNNTLENTLQLLIERTNDAIFLLDENEIFDCNSVAVRLFGASNKQQLLNMNLAIFSPKQQPDGQFSLDKANEMIRKSYQHNSYRFEWMHRKLSDEDFPCEVVLTSIPVQNKQLLYAVIRDISNRKKMEKEYIESNKILNSIINTVPDIIYRLDPEGNIIFISDAVTQYGYTSEELIGRSIFELIHPDDVEKAKYRINERRAGDRSTKSLELKLLTKDYKSVCFEIMANGNEFVKNVSISAEGIYNEVNEGIQIFCGSQGIARDITDRKKAENKLRESELSVQALIDAHPYPAFLITTDGIIYYVNEPLAKNINLNRDDLLGRNIYDVMPKSVAQKGKLLIEQAIKSGSPYKYEDTWENLYFLNYIYPVVDSDGIVSKIAVIAFDISDQKRKDNTIKESEEKYRNLVERSNDGVAIIQDNLVRYANNRLLKILGTTQEAIAGTLFSKYVAPQYIPVIKERYHNRIKGGNPPSIYEIKLLTKTGKEFDVELNAGVITFKGKPASFVFVRDISERKILEKQYLQAQKMETIGQLAGGVAHDFNNLLTIINGNAEIAMLSLSDEDPIKELLHEIKITGDRAANLTRQLLTFSRQEIVEPLVLNTNDVLFDMDKMLRRLIGKDIELVLLPESDIWNVMIDSGQLEQVITNLVVNARDAMSTNGKLTIETKNIKISDVNSESHIEVKHGDYVMILVTDTGIGINEETQEKIFEPFFTTKEKNKGTGIGLSTCYGIVKQNKGFICVLSKPGIGTTFKIYLPRVYEELAVNSTQTKMVDLPDGTESILVVDDEPSLRNMTVRLLIKKGYTVYEAENGDDALRILRDKLKGEIDLVISDMVMPQMGGKELSKVLEKIYPNLKILFMSGYTDGSIVQNGFLDRGVNFIQKPFAPNTLIQKTQDVLKRSELV